MDGPRARPAATAAVAVALLLCAVPRAPAQQLLTDAALHLEGARYLPGETPLAWTTWIGAGIGVARVRRLTGYVAGEVETVLGSERRAFDAEQSNYHLEGGLRVPAGALLLVPFFHHVSRHLVDRPKVPNEDWNIVGLRVAGGVPWRGGSRYAIALGRTVHTQYVTYAWELAGRLDVTLHHAVPLDTYAHLSARGVTTTRPAAPAGDGLSTTGAFLDFSAELGARLRRGERRLDVFLAFEHRNDVFLLQPGARDRGLVGLRFASSPADYVDAVWP
jgi:hypothetical protein